MVRTRTYAMALVLVSAALWACGGDDSTQPLAPSSSAASTTVRPTTATSKSNDVVGDLLGGLLGGKPQLFACQGNGGPYTGSATVGIFGGQVHIGPHTLSVPPLAVFKPTTITGTS